MSRADQDFSAVCRPRVHTSEWAVCASAVVSAQALPAWRRILARRAAPALAAILVLLGVIGVAVRLDAPGDGTTVSFWQVDGVIIDVPDLPASRELHTGDLVTVIAGHRLVDGLGGLPAPVPGDQLIYDIVRNTRPGGPGSGIDPPSSATPRQLRRQSVLIMSIRTRCWWLAGGI